jgi:hypothetical protein
MLHRSRMLVVAAAGVALSAADASAQRTRGTMSVPRVTTAQPARPSAGSGPRTVPRGGVMTVPRAGPGGQPRRGDLPRITTRPSRRGPVHYTPGGIGRGFPDRGSRYWRSSATRWGVGLGCGYGCYRVGAGVRVGPFAGHFIIGYPFVIPVAVPYYYESSYESYSEAAVASERAYEPERAASKLIVIGAGTGGGDALTVETLGDSVRLSWLGSSRPAREVRLFVSDSTQRQLATRSASPSAPSATFEIATLSAPVSFAGVTVVFADGVTTTTVVPYRGDAAGARQR